MKKTKNILIIRIDRLGDILMNLPMIRCIKMNNLNSRVTVLCNDYNKELMEKVKDIDNVEAININEINSLRGKLKLFLRLKNYNFDIAVISHPSKFFHFLIYILRIPLRVGFDKKCGVYLNKKIKDQKNTGTRHEIDCNLDLAYILCENKWDGKIEFELKKEDSDGACFEKISNNKKKIAVHLSTSNSIKEWSIVKFHEVCTILKEKGFEIILIGAIKDEQISASFKDTDNFIDLIGKTSLIELAKILRDVDCLLSLDSGPYHLAWMQKTPVVGIFIKEAFGSNIIRWGVYPDYIKAKEFYNSAKNISVENVVKAVENITSDLKKGTVNS